MNLIMELGFRRDTAPPVSIEVSGLAVFPGVRAPEFTITSIAILKAELVNTRFRVGLKIENPNPYPVDLSAFSYVLYGNGLRWADGTERDIIKVAGKSALTGNLYLIMNFIEMPRELLDQIIRLEDVNYRFTGEAVVITGLDYLPQFKSGFDMSGYSVVLDR
jgi:LEA14-like dessication related protein